MESLADAGRALDALLAQHPAATFAALFGAALVEYVFPPFPGDFVTVAGAALVARYGWSFWGVFAVVTLGSIAGAAIDFALGRYLHRRGVGSRNAALDRILGGFRRHGDAYLAVNRFLPGIRALFFVAAGMIGMSMRRVLLWAALSAVGWNLLLMGVGYLLGGHVEAIASFVARWALAAGAVIAVVGAVWAFRTWRGRRGSGGES